MKPQDEKLGQLGLGAMVFNFAFGIPFCLFLSARHFPAACVLLPILLGFPAVILLLRSKQTEGEVPREITAVTLLHFLQMCCVGWTLPALFTDPPLNSNAVLVPLGLYFVLGVARRAIWTRYLNHHASELSQTDGSVS